MVKHVSKDLFKFILFSVKDNDEGVRRVYYQTTFDAIKEEGKPYAFFMESKTINYNTQRKCNLTKKGDQLDDKNYGIGMRKGTLIIIISIKFLLKK